MTNGALCEPDNNEVDECSPPNDESGLIVVGICTPPIKPVDTNKEGVEFDSGDQPFDIDRVSNEFSKLCRFFSTIGGWVGEIKRLSPGYKLFALFCIIFPPQDDKVSIL